MIKLQTTVSDLPCRVGISYSDRICMLGSCFADNIGIQLKNYGFNVMVNPFGTLYNPVSVLNSVERLVSGKPFEEQDCIMMGSGADLYCSFSHHTSFARKSILEFLENANLKLAEASDFFRTCNRVIITFGTSWCFRHNESGSIVSNCLKRDAKEFTRERLSYDETVSVIDRIIRAASAAGADKEFIFTVSPIRHMKDGAHGNQLSKSNLLCAVDGICSSHDVCDYFPAYEIMMDELRDYRFYAEDMVHPSAQAVDYIRERFCKWALDSAEHPKLEENIRRFKREGHIEKGLSHVFGQK